MSTWLEEQLKQEIPNLNWQQATPESWWAFSSYLTFELEWVRTKFRIKVSYSDIALVDKTASSISEAVGIIKSLVSNLKMSIAPLVE